MQTFFTADTHFNHANIIKYSNRPFKDTVEMNDTIINNWNQVVREYDTVYHLGDFCFGRDDAYFNSVFPRLNGYIVLIKGNHDSLAWRNRYRFAACFDSYHEVKVEQQEITLCHYKMSVWNKSHHGAWHLYGHSHGSLPAGPNERCFDVGVDCHNFTPVSFDKVKAIMEKKTFVPIDHHGKREEGGGIGLSREDYAKAERKSRFLELKQEFEP